MHRCRPGLCCFLSWWFSLHGPVQGNSPQEALSPSVLTTPTLPEFSQLEVSCDVEFALCLVWIGNSDARGFHLILYLLWCFLRERVRNSWCRSQPMRCSLSPLCVSLSHAFSFFFLPGSLLLLLFSPSPPPTPPHPLPAILTGYQAQCLADSLCPILTCPVKLSGKCLLGGRIHFADGDRNCCRFLEEAKLYSVFLCRMRTL